MRISRCGDPNCRKEIKQNEGFHYLKITYCNVKCCIQHLKKVLAGLVEMYIND